LARAHGEAEGEEAGPLDALHRHEDGAEGGGDGEVAERETPAEDRCAGAAGREQHGAAREQHEGVEGGRGDRQPRLAWLRAITKALTRPAKNIASAPTKMSMPATAARIRGAASMVVWLVAVIGISAPAAPAA
jgi:hypothetical protein